MRENPIRKLQGRSSTTHPVTRRDFLSTSLKVGAAAFTTGLLPKPHAASEEQYNVVFIIADDLRPLLGCYGNPEIQTPNIDRLAERSTLFNHAYCQYPLCKPSRTSMLTGLRPDTNGVRDNHADFRQTVPDVVTLPQYFKVHGYHTRSVGKIDTVPQFYMMNFLGVCRFGGRDGDPIKGSLLGGHLTLPTTNSEMAKPQGRQ